MTTETIPDMLGMDWGEDGGYIRFGRWRVTPDAIREHIAVERRAAQAAIPERGAFAEGQAAALLSLDQWLAYQERQ